MINAKRSLLTLIALSASTAAFAGLSITVTNFTADDLTISVSGGAASAIEGPTPGALLNTIDIAPGPGTSWINSSTFTPSPSTGTLPATNLGTTISALKIYQDASGDTVYFDTSSPLQIGEYFTADFTLSWSATGLFDFNAVSTSNLNAYWGTNNSFDAASGTLQSASPLPEPGVIAMIAGVCALGLVIHRRKKSA